jgi:DNA repair protein RecO (recombination protein O)
LLKRTESIVFKCIKYGETSLIVQVFTPNDGIVPLIVSGVRSKNNKGKAAQFQVGQVLDVIYYDKQKEGIMRLKESSLSMHFKTIPFEIPKIALTQYFIEVTRNCIYQSALSSDDVYPLIIDSFLYLDQPSPPQSNLAVFYLWNLIDRLGLAPYLDAPRGEYLDLQSGEFCHSLPLHHAALHIDLVIKLKTMLEMDLNQIDSLDLSGKERKFLLESGHQYLRHHLSYFRLPKSADIFREILRM